MPLKPLGNRVLVERKKEDVTTKTGLIIPDSAKKKPFEGTVVAVSTKAENEGISKGDVVLFTEYGGTEISIDDKEYLIFNSDDILGILN